MNVVLWDKNKYFKLFLCLFSFLMFTLAVWGAARSHLPVPYWDMWNGTLKFISKVQDGDFSAWWGFHNEHRIFFSRVLFWVDYKFFKFNLWFLIAFNYVILIFIISVFYVFSIMINRYRGFSVILPNSFLFVFGFCFLWSQSQNFLWGFQSQFFLVQLLPLLALLMAAFSVTRSSSLLLVASGFVGFLAIGTMANGILALPVLTVYLGFQRRKIITIVIFACVSIVTILVYMQGIGGHVQGEGSPGTLTNFLSNPVGSLKYTLMYIGSPLYFLFESEYISLLGGVFFSFLFALYSLSLLIRSKTKASPFEWALIFYIGYILVSGLVTAAGRISFGFGSSLASRYTTPAIMAWSALIILLWGAPSLKWLLRRPVVVSVARLTVVVFCVFTLVKQTKALDGRPQQINESMQGMMALSMDVSDPEVTRKLYPHRSSYFFNIVEDARSRRLSAFGHFPFDHMVGGMGKSVETSGNIQCLGEIHNFEKIDDPNFYKLTGVLAWAEPQSLLTFIAEDQIIVGFALTELDSNAGQAYSAENDRPFVGYLLKSAVKHSGVDHIRVLGSDPPCSADFPVPVVSIEYLGSMPDVMGAAAVTTDDIVENDGFSGTDFWRSDIDGFQILGSFISSDEDTGLVSFLAENGMLFYYRSGPDTGNQRLLIPDFEIDIPLKKSTEWTAIQILAPSVSDHFNVIISDAGTEWGQWSAIAVGTKTNKE